MTRNGERAAAGLVLLSAMAAFGHFVLWDALWGHGLTGEEEMRAAMLYRAWSGIQVAFAVLVGIAMYRAAMEMIRARYAPSPSESSSEETRGSERRSRAHPQACESAAA